MRSLRILSATLPLLLLPCCVQTQQDSCTIEDVRFVSWQQPEREQALVRLMYYMQSQPRSVEMDAESLASASLLREGSPCGYLTLGEIEEAEEAYLELEEYERIRLAAEVMNALLSSPTQTMGGEEAGCAHEEEVHSYQKLNVSAIQRSAGDYFAHLPLPMKGADEKETQAAQEQVEHYRTALFKRMAARLILEDVACNPVLDLGMRCAALECLRHICRDGLLEADGAWESRYMVDALPLDAANKGLERALFGGPAWVWARE